MARAISRLTMLAVQRATKPGLYHDGGGLYLQVANGGSKSWLFRYGPQGRRYHGLGALHTIGLQAARARARACREMLLDGIDPITAKRERRQADRLAAAQAMTFAECASAYINSHRAGWKNAKHATQWSATLKTYADPVIGKLPVAAIDTGLVLKVLEPIWTTKPETANRVRGRIESVLDWAKVRGYRAGDNPAKWKGHFDHLLPPQRKVTAVEHHPALPYAELPAFIAELREREAVSARCLEFAILTAARTGEVIGATWDEIDVDAKTWTVPAKRMKAAKSHSVPLSDRALEILARVPREDGNPHLFVGRTKGAPLSNMAMLELLRGMRPGLTVHGFRAAFRTWCAERTAFPHLVCELALGHTQSDKLVQAYQRGDLIAQRRRLADAWAEFCSTPAAAGEVVALRRG